MIPVSLWTGPSIYEHGDLLRPNSAVWQAISSEMHFDSLSGNLEIRALSRNAIRARKPFQKYRSFRMPCFRTMLHAIQVFTYEKIARTASKHKRVTSALRRQKRKYIELPAQLWSALQFALARSSCFISEEISLNSLLTSIVFPARANKAYAFARFRPMAEPFQ